VSFRDKLYSEKSFGRVVAQFDKAIVVNKAIKHKQILFFIYLIYTNFHLVNKMLFSFYVEKYLYKLLNNPQNGDIIWK